MEQSEINEERLAQEYARMSNRRKSVGEIDVEARLNAFKLKHPLHSDKKKGKVLSMWMAALAGAAAMLAGVLLYFNLTDTDKGIIAMRYNEGPQLITLQLGEQIADLSDMDSLDLFRNVVKNQPVKEEQTSQSKPESLQCLSTPRGMDFKLILQDGTEVWLNAESTIEFPSSFVNNDTRRVNIKGEAYFKVARNESKPFVVSVDDKDIRVLGTEFNVRHYAAEKSTVALVKGSIQLCQQGEENGLTLQSGQGASWQEGGQPEVQDVDIYNVVQWVDGLFYFDEQPLDEILLELARWYNVGVRFTSHQHCGYKVHFSASRTDSLQQVLDDLNMLCSFKITLEDNEIVVF